MSSQSSRDISNPNHAVSGTLPAAQAGLPTNTIGIATSVEAISPSRIRELADVAWRLGDVLSVQFGESTLPTPAYISQALSQAVADGYTFYTENGGLPSLQQALSSKIRQLHGVEIDPDREIVVTASGTQALNVSIRCTINPGDEALILTPNWPNGGEIVRLYGATPVEVPYTPNGDSFGIDYGALEAAVTPRTRLLLYTSPSNPLGWVATETDQRRLLDFSRRHGLWLLADEVYERLYYNPGAERVGSEASPRVDGQVDSLAQTVAPSILRQCTREDAVIVVQSFSKAYCMTGWRLGWVVTRADLANKAKQMNEFIVSHAATMVQRAGETALAQGDDDVAALVEALGERRDFCHAALSALPGVQVSRPPGAFYLFPSISGVDDSFAFAMDLLKAERLAVAPGMAFGAGGEGHIRICYAPDMAVMEEAMTRLCRFIERG